MLDHVPSRFDVADDHVLFDDFFWSVTGFDWNFDRPTVFVQLEVDFPVFKDFELHSFLTMGQADFGQGLQFFNKSIELFDFCGWVFFEELIKINFGGNDILYGFITELEIAFNHIFLDSALSNNFSLHVHLDKNGKSESFDIGIEGCHFDKFRCEHVVHFVGQVDRGCSFDELVAVDVFEVLWDVGDVDANLVDVCI